jgi:two-component system sensor histidine kinase/response regulator
MSVLDQTVIEQLRRLQRPGRPDFVAELVNLFLQTASIQAQQVREAVQSRRLDLLPAAAHSLKSGAANVGAMRLSQVCLQLEKIGDRAISDYNLAAVANIFESEYTSAVKELQSLLVQN